MTVFRYLFHCEIFPLEAMKQMLLRLFTCGLLLYGAAAIDLGLPTWIHIPGPPSFLTLLLVLFCQSLRGGELVAWGGAIGLYQDFLVGDPPGTGMMTAATLALYITWRQAADPAHEQRLIDQLLSGMGMLLFLGLARGIRIALTIPDVALSPLVSGLLIRTAATYLLYVVLCCLWSGVRRIGRRSYRLENSCV